MEPRVFVDTKRAVATRYYDALQKDIELDEKLEAMKELIAQDKDFYESYITASDILFCQEEPEQAAQLLAQAYVEAVNRIADEHGNWPDVLEWSIESNQHILRALEEYGLFLWENEQTSEALELFRRILCMNPADQQGIRYNMLAIKMNLDVYEWDEQFIVEDEHGCQDLDDAKIEAWFAHHAPQFPDEFQWLLQYYAQSEE